MLGTFGMRPKATMRSRALGMAQELCRRGWDAAIVTVPWDNPADGGRCWIEDGIQIVNTRSSTPALWPLAVREISQFARAFNPDLIHVFKPKGFGDLAARSLARDYPIVVDMDDWEGDGGWNDSGLYGPIERRVFEWQERTLPPQAAAVTIASQCLGGRALQSGTDPRRIFYLPNALTQDRFVSLAPSSSRLTGPRILLYTRFVEFDPVIIAEIMGLVRQSEPNARLLIAGGSSDGAAETRLKRAAEECGVTESIEWVGWIVPDDLPRLAAGCRLAIHPFDDTLLNRAKCSVKLLELMACGLPVVTSAVGENASCIEDSRNGILVSAGDIPGMANAIVDLLGDVDRCLEIGRAARSRIEQDYLWPRRIETLLAAYDYALAGH